MSEIKDVVCDFNNLYDSLQDCCNGVKWKDGMAKIYNNALVSTYNIWKPLQDGTQSIDPYNRFIIHEPKTRIVTSTQPKDRIAEKSFCDNYYIEAVTKTFVHDNGACQKGKGTDFARDRLVTLLRRYYKENGNQGYVMQLDVKSFFGSTRHDVLKEVLGKIVTDEWARSFLFAIIDSYREEGVDVQRGIGLGSETNQYSQLTLLSDIDHMVKERYQIMVYDRYMDDFTLVHQSKEHLQEVLRNVHGRMDEKGLLLNSKKSHIYPIKQGIPFLGFVFHLTDTGKVIIRISKENIRRRKRKIRGFERLLERDEISLDVVHQSMRSWLAHVDKCHGHEVRKNMVEYYQKHLGRFYGIQQGNDRGIA